MSSSSTDPTTLALQRLLARMARQRGEGAAVLINHVEKSESTAVGCGIKLEIHGPCLVGMLKPVAPHGAVGWSASLAIPGDGLLQALLPTEPWRTFLVHPPVLFPQKAKYHPPEPAVINSGLAGTMMQHSLLNRDDLCGMTLGATTLKHHTTGQRLR